MKVFNTIKEMESGGAPAIAIEYITQVVKGHGPDQGPLLDGESEFDYHLGGQVHIVEAKDELRQIALPGESKLPESERPSHGWETPLDAGTGTDQAGWMPGREWVLIWTAWNNAGGPTYFIPRSIVEEVPNILQIIANSEPANGDEITWNRESANADPADIDPQRG